MNSYIHVVNCVFCTFLLRYSLKIFKQYVLHYKSFTGKKSNYWYLGFSFYEDSLKTFRTSLVIYKYIFKLILNYFPESGSDGLPNCTVAYGSAKQLAHNPSLFEVSCNHGYNLNNIAEFFTCQDGHFYPDGLDIDLSSSTGHVECLPGTTT